MLAVSSASESFMYYTTREYLCTRGEEQIIGLVSLDTNTMFDVQF